MLLAEGSRAQLEAFLGKDKDLTTITSKDDEGEEAGPHPIPSKHCILSIGRGADRSKHCILSIGREAARSKQCILSIGMG